MKINLPSISLSTQQSQVNNPANRGVVHLMSLGGTGARSAVTRAASPQAPAPGPATPPGNSAAQQLLRASLAGAAAVNPEALQKAMEALEKDTKKFFASTKIDEDSVSGTLKHLSSVLHGKTAPEKPDVFAAYVARRIGVAPEMIASAIEHMEDGDDAATAAKATAIIEYAVSILDAKVVKQIVSACYNRQRVELLNLQLATALSLEDQVRTNTDNIRELMKHHKDSSTA